MPADAPTDLPPLNDHEHTALRLLAQGHRVKSIAALTGRSEASVNERLREARRKTGVGSSRELARMVAAQENRDEQIGIDPPPPDAQPSPPKSARRGLGWKGPLVMIALLLGIAALTYRQDAPPPPQHSPAELALDFDRQLAPMQPNEMPRALHERFKREKRDAAWAPPAEARLRQQIGAIDGITSVKVECRASLCEMTGMLKPGLSQPQKDAVLRALTADSPAALRIDGFRNSGWVFMKGNDPDPTAIGTIWQRADP